MNERPKTSKNTPSFWVQFWNDPLKTLNVKTTLGSKSTALKILHEMIDLFFNENPSLKKTYSIAGESHTVEDMSEAIEAGFQKLGRQYSTTYADSNDEDAKATFRKSIAQYVYVNIKSWERYEVKSFLNGRIVERDYDATGMGVIPEGTVKFPIIFECAFVQYREKFNDLILDAITLALPIFENSTKKTPQTYIDRQSEIAETPKEIAEEHKKINERAYNL